MRPESLVSAGGPGISPACSAGGLSPPGRRPR
jgi:hypothetical protein